MTGTQYPQDLSKPLPDLFQLASVRGGDGERQRRLLALGFRPQLLARSGNGKTLIVKELLDPENVFHVNLAVHPLAGTALGGLKLVELGFPEAEHVAGEAAKAADFANAKVKLVRNHNFAGNGFPDGSLCKFVHAVHGRSG